MFKYVLKRLLYFVPTFIVISLITFALGQMAPGDPVELKLKGGMSGNVNGLSEKQTGEKQYLELSEKLGRNLPAFYFGITSAAYPDTLYKIPRAIERDNLSRLINKYGNWPQISKFYATGKKFELALFALPIDTIDRTTFTRVQTARESVNNLFISYDDTLINQSLRAIMEAVNYKSEVVRDSGAAPISYYAMAKVQPLANEVMDAYNKMINEATPNKNYQPAIQFYGIRNQYHRWIFGDMPWFKKNEDASRSCYGFLRGDFGKSYQDGRKVSSIIKESMSLTLIINFFEFLLIYLIAIPMGVSLATKKGTSYDRIVTSVNFVLYSLPTFWIATLMIIFFTNGHYAEWMNIFPDHGIGKTGAEFTFMERLTDRAYHLALPMFCMLLGAFAFVSRMMRGSMLSVLRQDYIRTAFAKGLTPNKVVWKHAFRNSLIPIVTMFASFLPAMISGAVIIEYIFTIPAMGRVSYESVVSRNYPVLFTILMCSAILTMAGNLIADILYGFVDPRISLTKKS